MNWPRILADLKAGGYSQDDVAQLLTTRLGRPVSQPTVSRWARGKGEPSFSEGQVLIDLRSGLTFELEGSADAGGNVPVA